MKVIDVYSQYFEGDCTFNGVKRRGALVRLTATSEEGNIRYDVGLTFFPHIDSEDFGPAGGDDLLSQGTQVQKEGRSTA